MRHVFCVTSVKMSKLWTDFTEPVRGKRTRTPSKQSLLMTSLENDTQVQTASDRKLHFIIAGSKLLHLIFQEFGLEFISCPKEDPSLLLHVDLKKQQL